MSEIIKVINRQEVNTLEESTELHMYKMPSFMGKVYPKIHQLIKAAGEEPSEPPYARYYDVNWEELMTQSKFKMLIDVFRHKWKFSAGFPVSSNMEAKEGVVKSTLPGGAFIHTIHKGPYQKVSETYKEMVKYAKANNIKIQPESIEFYTNDPTKVDKKDIETEVLIPIIE